jgi:hypothetical protein
VPHHEDIDIDPIENCINFHSSDRAPAIRDALHIRGRRPVLKALLCAGTERGPLRVPGNLVVLAHVGGRALAYVLLQTVEAGKKEQVLHEFGYGHVWLENV